MRGRNKASKRTPAPGPSNPSVAAAAPPPQEQESYEGERLNFLIQAVQSKIETARALDGDVLPEKLWFKQQFAVGVNEVTRFLEWMPAFSESRIDSQKPNNANLSTTKASKLQVILIASDCNPKWLIRHLPSLASSRNVPLIFIRDKKQGSVRLGELIKLKTAIAVGIKDKGNAVNHFIDKLLLGDHSDLGLHAHPERS